MSDLLRTLLDGAPLASVGLATADPLALGAQIEQLGRAGVRLLHVDVMDGVFCPQMTGGPSLVRALPDGYVRDVHLMVDEPLAKVADYVEAGADVVTFHVEATRHPHRVLQSLAGAGVVRGVALNPGTPVSVLEPLLDELELVLLLSVNPGWSGQRFLETTWARLDAVRTLVGDRDVVLAVDGGVGTAQLPGLVGRGAGVVVTGGAVFGAESAFAGARAVLDGLSAAARAPAPAAGGGARAT